MDRPAGLKVIEFFTETPLGEEILEGGGGGLLTGLSQIGSDKSPGQIALETAAAMIGGVVMGSAGRKIGARIGKRVHRNPLKDQGGMPATIGRMMGNETTGKGMKEMAIMGREAIKDSLISQTSSRMINEAMNDPAMFAKRYGIDPKEFLNQAEAVGMGNKAAAAMRTLEAMPPEQREAFIKGIRGKMSQYEAVENLIANQAHSNFDDTVRNLANNSERIGSDVSKLFNEVEGADGMADFMGSKVSRALEGLDRPVEDVTGEHVGRAVGRFIGDEVGILGGMAMGSLLAQQLGMESPKDRRIRELEKQLSGAG